MGQVPVDDIQTIIWVDCTKLGVVTQPEINALGDFLEKHLSRNPVRGFFKLQQIFEFFQHSESYG